MSIIDVVDNVDEMIFTSTYQKMAFRNGDDFSQKKLPPFLEVRLHVQSLRRWITVQ